MNESEIKKAMKLLDDYTERFSKAIITDVGQCLTAYWTGGGQKVFADLDEVNEWVRERN